jgi:polyphenol oxidase
MTPGQVVQVHQVHGRDILEVRPDDQRAGRVFGPADATEPVEADILISNDPSRAVAVRVADCVPLLLSDDTGQIVAAVHAGWRGVARRGALAAVDRLHERFGVRAERLVAAAGPSIGPCCYEVGEDVREAFRGQGQAVEFLDQWFRPGKAAGKFQLDLWTAIGDQLEGAGLMPGHIFSAGLCTVCHPAVFPSYRRDGAAAGRLAGIIKPFGP